MHVNTALKIAKKILNDNGIDTYALDAELLLAHELMCDRYQLFINSDYVMTQAQYDNYMILIARRVLFEPVAYIVGYKEFWSLKYAVTDDVLIPRADSETLIEAVLKWYPKRDGDYNIIDLGSGSGCLGLTLLHEYKEANCLFVDYSIAALEVAMKNSVNLSMNSRSTFIKSDWLNDVKPEKFDIIISNPPYIDDSEISAIALETYKYEPHLALFSPVNAYSCYINILKSIRSFMHPESIVFLEVGVDRALDIVSIAAEIGFNCVEIAKDLSGIERCLILK